VTSLANSAECTAVAGCFYRMPAGTTAFLECEHRGDCNGHGDCINSKGQNNLASGFARCECDSGWSGPTCHLQVTSLSIAGQSVGGCIVPCQNMLDDMYDECIEVNFFAEMEDDTRLPTRAEDIHCSMKGMSGEKNEIEATIFEDYHTLPDFALQMVITLYVCYALALVCEDFFVASLDIIIEKLDLSPDVAGATFMAAGSSAPELFVSAAGVFITHDPVGVGACAGSTMFNTMCIIGGSALIAGKPVPLQWRSVVRDGGIYVISCVVLVILLWDGKIEMWDSIVLLSMYVSYIVIAAMFPKLVSCCCPINGENKQALHDETDQELLSNAQEEKHHTGVMARRQTGAFLKGQSVANLDVLLTATVELSKNSTNILNDNSQHQAETSVVGGAEARHRARTATQAVLLGGSGAQTGYGGDLETDGSLGPATGRSRTATAQIMEAQAHGQAEGHHEHGLCVIPEGSSARLAWLISFPLMLAFTFTIPNCGKHPRLYLLTFLICIAWLGFLVEIMVEHASEVGAHIGFSPGVMGLTLLAAGTSFPDLVASLIVAKKGSIDMAVSNAFGSNNFDILLCLGLPWFLACAFYGPVLIDTAGIMTALMSLIVTTVIWLIYMHLTKWVLTPGVGFAMLTTYGTWLICQFMFDLFSPHAHE